MMALAVKNTKLMGTTSVASNTFIASLRNLWAKEKDIEAIGGSKCSLQDAGGAHNHYFFNIIFESFVTSPGCTQGL